MSGYPFALALSVIALATILYLLWKRRIREKYVFLWILLMAAICVIGAFPALVYRIAAIVGLETPANLLFAGAIVVLLIVCVQLSSEASQLQEKTRTLAEEVAMLRLDAQQLTEQLANPSSGTSGPLTTSDPQHETIQRPELRPPTIAMHPTPRQ